MAIHLENKSYSATKAGPGRVHLQGYTKARKPKRRGAGFGFVPHQASPAKRAQRAQVKALGRRQSLKATKAARRIARGA